MLLSGKSVVIYGANSPTGATVAQAFAAAGAVVYLAGRSVSRLEPLARAIAQADGKAEVAEVDPLDLSSVSEHLHRVAVEHGSVDVSLNLAFLGVEGSARLCNLSAEQFDSAAFTRLRSNFVTAAAAVKQMAYRGHGVILATAVPEWVAPVGHMAGPAIGSAAIERLCDQLLVDVGSFGVRAVYVADVGRSGEAMAEKLLRVVAPISQNARYSGTMTPDAAGAASSGRPEAPAADVTS